MKVWIIFPALEPLLTRSRCTTPLHSSVTQAGGNGAGPPQSRCLEGGVRNTLSRPIRVHSPGRAVFNDSSTLVLSGSVNSNGVRSIHMLIPLTQPHEGRQDLFTAPLKSCAWGRSRAARAFTLTQPRCTALQASHPRSCRAKHPHFQELRGALLYRCAALSRRCHGAKA